MMPRDCSSVFSPAAVLTGTDRVGGGRHQTVFSQPLHQRDIDMLFFNGDDIGFAQRVIQFIDGCVDIPCANQAESSDAVGTFAGICNERKLVAHFPSGEGQHPRQLATACDGNPHQLTEWGTLAVCCARQVCRAADSSVLEVAKIWAAMSPAL